MRRSSRSAVAAFVVGLGLGAPLVAWSGGDVCAPFHESQWDQADVQLASWTIDGVAQPIAAGAQGTVRSWTPNDSGVDDTHAYATLPDPRDGTQTLMLYLVRQP